MKVVIDKIAAFMADDSGWPQPASDWYYDTDGTHPLDTELISDESGYKPNEPGKLVTLEDFECELLYQGADKDFAEDFAKRDSLSWVSYFKKWDKKQRCETILCDIPKTQLAQFKVALKRLGGKIIK